MDVTSLPDIVNNKDLTQHFLYSYAHVNKIGPSDKLKSMHVDDLIFDRSRKSIFTQNQEFGYINDFRTSVCIGSYVEGVNSYMDLFTYEGVQNAYTFVPWYVSDFVVTKQVASKIKPIEQINKEIDLDSIRWNMYGTTERYHFRPEVPNNPIQKIDTKPHTCELSYTVGDSDNIILYSNTAVAPAYKDLYYALPGNCSLPLLACVNSSLIPDKFGKLTFILKLSCSEYPNSYSFAYQTHEIANYITFHSIRNISSIFDLEEKLVSNTSVNVTNYGILTNDYTFSNSHLDLTCNNGKDEYLGIGIPKRLCAHNDIDIYSDVLYGTLGFGPLQEFKYVEISAENKIALNFNDCNSIEDYRYYFATNNNWQGFSIQSLFFRNT